MNNKMIHMVAFSLLVVGGVNWLLTAFGYNVVDMVFGEMSTISKVIYVLIGLAAVYEVVTHKAGCRHCSASGGGAGGAGGSGGIGGV